MAEKTIAENIFNDYMAIPTVGNLYGTFRDQSKLIAFLREIDDLKGVKRIFPYGGGYADPTIGYIFSDGSYLEVDNPRQHTLPVFATWYDNSKYL